MCFRNAQEQKASEPGPIKYLLFLSSYIFFQQKPAADTWKQYKTRKAHTATSCNYSSIMQHFTAHEILSRLVSLHLIVIFCKFGWLPSEPIQISICNTLWKGISHFSELLCDTCSKCVPVHQFHLLLPTSGIRRHSALLFPTSLCPSQSRLYMIFMEYVSTPGLTQVLYWEVCQPLQSLLQGYTATPATDSKGSLDSFWSCLNFHYQTMRQWLSLPLPLTGIQL